MEKHKKTLKMKKSGLFFQKNMKKNRVILTNFGFFANVRNCYRTSHTQKIAARTHITCMFWTPFPVAHRTCANGGMCECAHMCAMCKIAPQLTVCILDTYKYFWQWSNMLFCYHVQKKKNEIETKSNWKSVAVK